VLTQLIEAGMDVARLNFSHGDHDSHAEVYGRIREAASKARRTVAILQDLCGPKIRLGEIEPNVVLEPGQMLELLSEPVLGNPLRVSISYPNLADDLHPGDRVLIDDGKIQLQVEHIQGTSVVARVIYGGLLLSHKGVNLPGANLSIPALTTKDEEDLAFGLSLGVDLVALSFVRHVADLELAREVMRRVGIIRPLIAKIEKPEALDELEEIVRAADGIMVARGDLGVEMAYEEVPIIQKEIIKTCLLHAKPVITATQMLESMIAASTPTRAEVTDVANAIFDGTDAIMLSGETASGKYPVLAVQTMHRIAIRAERNLEYDKVLKEVAPLGKSGEALALAACEIAEELQVTAIVACTATGATVRRLASNRPRAPILAITTEVQLLRQLVLTWGAIPMLIPAFKSVEAMVEWSEAVARDTGHLVPGDTFVLVGGYPFGSPTNFINVRQL
jgi:pyruvate kinase